MATSGFDPATTPGGMTTATAVISAMINGTRTPIAVTKGGAGFDPGTKWRAAEYDGRRGIIAGTEEQVEFGAKMTATFVEFSEKVTGILIPGAVANGDNGGVSPIDANLALTIGDYLELPWYQIPLKDGRSLVYEFPLGIITEWPIDTKDKDEASLKVTIEARLNPEAADFRDSMPDFRMFYLPAA